MVDVGMKLGMEKHSLLVRNLEMGNASAQLVSEGMVLKNVEVLRYTTINCLRLTFASLCYDSKWGRNNFCGAQVISLWNISDIKRLLWCCHSCLP
uniref:Uncharacterized protein n=1 Tax=Arundo donax TaxID=35708 RepID=A0A0A9D6W5_ARUDO